MCFRELSPTPVYIDLIPLFSTGKAVFMSQETKIVQKWALDSVALQDAYTDFILSRQAALLSENTILFYQFTAGLFVR